MRGGKHAMLHRHDTFSGLAADFATHALLARARLETTRRLTDGEFAFEV